MSDDFEGIPLDLPADVPASVTKYGDEYGQEILDNTGEQNQSLAGDAAFNDETRPNQTINNPNSVSNTTDYGDYGAPTGEGAAGTSTTVSLDPTAGLTPEQLKALGTADPTDPYIRARLGIPQLPGDDTLKNGNANLTFLKDLATAPSSTIQKALSTFTGSAAASQSPYGQILGSAQKALSALTSKTSAASPYAQTAGLQRSDSALTSSPASTKDEFGLTILDAAQTAQVTGAINPAFRNGLVPTVDTGAGEAIATANQQTIIDAARLNAYSEIPNPYLTYIDQAGTAIAKGQEGIATANQTIQSAQQKITDSESIIAQNNAELADPNISDARRAELEANNAAQVQNVFDQTQSINENQAYIANTQETITFNEATIDANSAGYRASTGQSSSPASVSDPYAGLTPEQIKALGNADPTDPYIRARLGIPQLPNSPLTTQQADQGNFLTKSATPVDANTASLANVTATVVGATTTNVTAAEASAIQTQVGRQLANKQAVNAAQKKSINNGDWRVRLSLAPGADYLYNAPDPGILDALTATDGVIFPYTPKITMNYKADYDQYALTHSNYKGYFYKSSYASEVQMHAVFTAQDSQEANYLLAVIHFFRSVTKMFYGQDPQRGAPPPLVYLTGLGQYQFSVHPCVVTSFSYDLPENVDYIRARSTNINGTNLLTRRVKQDLPTNPISGAVGRLATLFSGQGISYGAEICRPPPPTLGQNQPTYVPTKLEINLNLLPIQSRQQVSREFSLRDYANGNLIKRGFW
jgi:hypothetical protein